MTLYKSDDIVILSENWDRIRGEVQKKRQDFLLEPSLDEKKKIQQIILEYITKNKRKVYGGFALNLLVSDKNPSDAIYTENDVADIDVYSPDPIIDLMKICNILSERNYKYVMGKEALHQETYSIFVSNILYCDISYVPRNIYNKMPFKEIKNIMVIHPNFMTIDYLRMLCDPLISFWRIDQDLKAFKRFVLIQKYYPLPYSNSPIEISGSTSSLDIALDVINQFIKDRKTIVNVGFYAYNYFLKESKIINTKTEKTKKIKYITVPYFEMISTDYRTDFFDLMKVLNANDLLKSTKIKHIEHYPFFQFIGHSVEIYLGDDIIAKIYNNNRKCIPYMDVPAFSFSDNNFTETKKAVVRIGTFQVALLYALIQTIKTLLSYQCQCTASAVFVAFTNCI